MTQFTNRQKMQCAQREVNQRRRVYPRWVEQGRMTQSLANEQIAMMEEIAVEYGAAAEQDDKAGRLI